MKLGIPHAIRVQKKVTGADLQRFMNFVDVDPKCGCWLWTGYCDEHGYGQFWWHGKMHWAHRWSLAAFKGDIPRNYDADHHDNCRNPTCVAPFHLKPSHRISHGRRHGSEATTPRSPDLATLPDEPPF